MSLILTFVSFANENEQTANEKDLLQDWRNKDNNTERSLARKTEEYDLFCYGTVFHFISDDAKEKFKYCSGNSVIVQYA